jgi:hypothetical protein
VGVRAVVVTVATPPTSGAEVGVPLIVTITDPVGMHVAGPAAVTMTTKVTDSQQTEGSGSGMIVVADAAWVTVGVKEVVEPVKQASPP